MNAIREVGWRKTLRFAAYTLFTAAFDCLLFPPLRSMALSIVGAKIGQDSVVHNVRFFNAYRTGFKGLELGARCFIGNECLIDLADAVVLGDEATLAERVTILTHTNVGYADHPLQSLFPAFSAPVRLERGAFVGANATILPGITIGECSFVAAGSVVVESVPKWTLVAGVPARVLRSLRSE